MWLRKCGYMERTGITGHLHIRTLPSVGACDRTGSFILHVLNALARESGSKKKVALVEKGR
jgi:hypothetical protein